MKKKFKRKSKRFLRRKNVVYAKARVGKKGKIRRVALARADEVRGLMPREAMTLKNNLSKSVVKILKKAGVPKGSTNIRIGKSVITYRSPSGFLSFKHRSKSGAIKEVRAKNPLPKGVFPIYAHTEKIWMRKGGKDQSHYPNQRFVHKFKPGVRQLALPAGAIIRIPGTNKALRLKKRAVILAGGQNLWGKYAA